MKVTEMHRYMPGPPPLGHNPGGVLVLDIKHKEGAVLTGGKEHSIIVREHQLRDGRSAASELLKLPIQRVFVGSDAACLCAGKQHPPAYTVQVFEVRLQGHRDGRKQGKCVGGGGGDVQGGRDGGCRGWRRVYGQKGHVDLGGLPRAKGGGGGMDVGLQSGFKG